MARRPVQEFNRESDRIMRACDELERQWLAGELSDEEFEESAHEILGDDYPED